MITSIQIFKESILVPRNLDSRQEKLKQQNLKMLQQEVIEGDLTIDSSFDFNSDQVKVKVKTIRGNVRFHLVHFPLWMKDVTIEGSFNCPGNELISLEGCPKSINGNFNCSYNQLKTLKGCPQSVGKNFFCDHNELRSLEGCPQAIDGDFYCNNNQLTTLEGCPQSIGGDFFCNNNLTEFTEDYVQTLSDVKGIIYY